jgi:hypothetical protein
MNITLEQLERAVRSCTPGAPPSYAERLWEAMETDGKDAQELAAERIHGIYGRTLEDPGDGYDVRPP